MIPRLEVNKKLVRENLKTKYDRKDLYRLLRAAKIRGSEKSFVAYCSNANCFLGLFIGYEEFIEQPKLIDYGYGLTVSSLNKYIYRKYGKDIEKKYLIEISAMSFEYEKPWKSGYFLNLSGENTGQDWMDIDGIKELMKKASIKNCFISFAVFDITKP